MQTISGLLMPILGLGMVAVAIQGAFQGWLPDGPNGFKRGKGVYRVSNPVGVWLVFCM